MKTRLIVFTILAALLIFVAIFADGLCPYDPYAQDLTVAYSAPGPEHLLGTDAFGRDMLSRVIVGAKVSVLSTLALVGVITIVGALIGVSAGYFGGAFDTVMMRISDFCMAFPGLVFALAVAAILGVVL